MTALSDPRQVLGEGPFGVLLSVLARAQDVGLLGPGPVEPHVVRALDILPLLPVPAGRLLDLGSGGGVPGLPLALAGTGTTWVLLDGSVTRCRFLEWATGELGLSARVEVVAARAEEAARRAEWRGRFGAVVARSFGSPAVTAENAAGFLEVGGRLIVAEPPGGEVDRWPEAGLQPLGLRPLTAVVEPSAFQVLVQEGPCPDRYPRRTGVPAKRPLF